NIDSKLKLRIYLQEGFPVFIEGGDDSTLLGRIAVAEGLIQSQDLETAIKSVARRKRKIGEALIELGSISHHELDQLLEHQVGEKLIRGFQCTSGTYNFKEGDNFTGSILIYKIDPLYVMYEGIKRFEGVREIEKKLFTVEAGEAGEIAIALQVEFEEKLKSMSFISPRELRFLRLLGEKKILGLKDVLSSGMLGKTDMTKLLYFLNLVGFIEIKRPMEYQTDNDIQPM
ncbi:MAG TPA: DUF4388 domain-containing protein, partial [Thermodesulfobacteriota bacterium]|nr:DUF4388 domain-containing protein [Thermodesulfobacteriota bacterium]